jgi:hypothetical protein
MEQSYTTNLLLKYLYRETSLTETLEIENAISESPMTKKEYLKLRNGYLRFPKVKFYPTDETMSSILNYSKSVAIGC